MGYKNRAFVGASWMGVLRVATRIITFFRLAILARILSPTQFGIFAVGSLVLALVEVLTETGINVFLIQKKDEARFYLNSAWIISILRGFIIAFVIILFSPLIVHFFNSEASYPILFLIAIVPLIRGFINPSIISIQKEIQFHKEFYLRSTLLFIDTSVAIIAAFVTRSAESFVYGLIASAIVEVILSFVFFKPYPRLSWEISKIKYVITKGSWVTVTGIFVYLSENIDNLAVGKILGTFYLGIYQSAYKISTLTISEINEVINRVTFPVYSKLSDDKNRLLNAFSKVTVTTSLVAVLFGLVIFFLAEPIVLILLGPKWLQAVPIVKILSFYGILRTCFGNFSAFFISLEKQNYVATTTFIRLAVLAVILVPLISMYGMVGAGYAMLISMIAEIPTIAYFTYRLVKK